MRYRSQKKVDVLIVGAGFAGLRALYSARKNGFSAQVIETADGIGGVWYWNRYPGARCDIESYDYSYAFSPELQEEWRWSERYATQPEILRYIEYTAEKFDLMKDIQLETTLVRAEFDEVNCHWRSVSSRDETIVSTYLIMATGQLSATKIPDIPGRDSFEGLTLHTGEWPHRELDFTGKRVGVIGTGSSGVQLSPIVAESAGALKVFQRTPTFSVPANNAPITDEEDRAIKADYGHRRKQVKQSPSGLGIIPNKVSALDVSERERRQRYEDLYPRAGFGFALAYKDLLLNEEANMTVADFLREKIAEKVEDPSTAAKLTPRGYPFGAKRPSVDSGYYEMFNRENVTLVDIGGVGIERVDETGIWASGEHHELDVIVFATGFDAFTGALLRPEIIGRDGLQLREKWKSGPTTYLGLSTAGFPNMFIIAGPGSPSLLANVVVGIEQHVDWIVDLIQHAQRNSAAVVEADEDAETRWVEHVNTRAKETLYLKAASYYLGANIPGKPRVFMPYTGGLRGYQRILDDVQANSYRGFYIKSADNTLIETTQAEVLGTS